jgi:hypothetical protein
VAGMDPGVRGEAQGRLIDLFRGIGQERTSRGPDGDGGGSGGGGGGGGGLLGDGLLEDVEEFMTMPLDLAVIFLDMSVELAELVLKSLEEAGFTLVKGLTPL